MNERNPVIVISCVFFTRFREAGRGENPISKGKRELEVQSFNKLVERRRQYAGHYKKSRKNYGKLTKMKYTLT